MSREAAMAIATGQPVPTPAAETVVTTPPESVAAATTDIPSKQFSQLANKEAEIVRQRQEFKKQQEEFASTKTKYDEVAKKYQEYEALKSKDPVAAMKMLGFNETDIWNYMANAQPPELTPEQKAAKAGEEAASAKIKAFEDSQAKKAADVQKQADEQVIQNYRGSVSKAITGNPEKYEYCAHYGAVAEDLIYETVLAVVAESKGADVPTPEEAAQMVEDFYEEQDKAMSKLKKRQPAAPAQDEPLKAQVSPQTTTRTRTMAETPKPPARTLTSAARATVAATKPLNETRDQKRERLINKLRTGG